MDSKDFDELSHALDLMEQAWSKGIAEPCRLAGDKQERLQKLLADMHQVQAFAMAVANGDLSHSLKLKGFTAGSLKTLQANLRHLTWQTKMVAEGDLTQRVDFMGEFAESFNSMVQNLADAREQLERANTLLIEEINERKRAEERLRQANERLQTQLRENEALRDQLREQAIHDPLTNLFNRRYLQEMLARELASAARDHHSVSVLMLDIDHFKRLNDTYGHQAGDLVLVALGELLSLQTRHADVACRYGGEEFVVVMPGAMLAFAAQRGEQLRQRFEALRVPYAETELRATLSLGVAAFPQHGESGDQVLRAADHALYAAKASGRNRVCAAEDEFAGPEGFHSAPSTN
ncbi:MAG: diguanylate cyclase [Methylococcaceae bacterium]|nr:diguanylate cyclase [Methylococcaceae bacterium]